MLKWNFIFSFSIKKKKTSEGFSVLFYQQKHDLSILVQF